MAARNMHVDVHDAAYGERDEAGYGDDQHYFLCRAFSFGAALLLDWCWFRCCGDLWAVM